MPMPTISSLALSTITKRLTSTELASLARKRKKDTDALEQTTQHEEEEKEQNAPQGAVEHAKKELTQYPVPASPIVSGDVVTDAMLKRALVRVGTDPLRTNGLLYTNVTAEQRNLCDFCAAVDWRAMVIRNIKPSETLRASLDETSLSRLSEREWEDFRLGTWANVKFHQAICTLCDLIYRGLQELYGLDTRSDVRMKPEEDIVILCRCENSNTPPPPWPEKLLEHADIFGKLRLKFRFQGIELVRGFGTIGFPDLELSVVNDVTRLVGDAYSELLVKKSAMPPVSDGQINIETLKFWAQQCQFDHSLCRSGWQGLMRIRRSKTRSYKLRLIDCSSLKVVVAKGNCRYASLSYVWGQVEQYTSRTQDIVSIDGDPDSEFIELQDRKISQTVADAIFVTKEMGIRYLWVDTGKSDEVVMRQYARHLLTLYSYLYSMHHTGRRHRKEANTFCHG